MPHPHLHHRVLPPVRQVRQRCGGVRLRVCAVTCEGAVQCTRVIRAFIQKIRIELSQATGIQTFSYEQIELTTPEAHCSMISAYSRIYDVTFA
ncbi:hypothetical protein AN958_10606 [Leucoagaricus sp. SymC.cos]|nr:hypothetical protein AN958_10606 [Leucoagaricus sp. SymC.cos]